MRKVRFRLRFHIKGKLLGEYFADILDGFLKSSNSLLHCILRHCGVNKLRLIPQNLCASNFNFFLCQLSLIFYGVINFVCGKIIIELKCVENLSKLHEAQILNYLKATGLRVGFLVNFKYPKAEIKLMVLGLKE